MIASLISSALITFIIILLAFWPLTLIFANGNEIITPNITDKKPIKIDMPAAKDKKKQRLQTAITLEVLV